MNIGGTYMDNGRSNNYHFGRIQKPIQFREQLLYARKNHIPIDVCGISYTDKHPCEGMRVMETGNYMVDYEGDSEGHIVAIHIDNVTRNN